jgi:hypothetical protein
MTLRLADGPDEIHKILILIAKERTGCALSQRKKLGLRQLKGRPYSGPIDRVPCSFLVRGPHAVK